MHERLGKYELVRHLASGGMASVYLARLSGLGGFERHVVLKTLRTEGLADDTLVPMFLDEARLIARLHHQHIAQVYEVGRDDATYYLAMEYVHGETVRAVLETANKHGHRLGLDFGLTVVCAAAAGLHHAHERRDLAGTPLGIVHRDVTPSNVIVSYDGSIKLIDFGIAKANDRSIRTRSGLIKGKAGYMAPEQVRGYPVDRRSDVFALGVLAYELTTQSRAFQADSQFEQLERIANGTFVPPASIVPDYPEELENVVMRALEVDPDDRYPDAQAVRAELERVARKLGLGLGEDCVMEVLAELYGARPEPWLVAPGSIDYDITPSIHDMPFAIEVIDRQRDDEDITTTPVPLEPAEPASDRPELPESEAPESTGSADFADARYPRLVHTATAIVLPPRIWPLIAAAALAAVCASGVVLLLAFGRSGSDADDEVVSTEAPAPAQRVSPSVTSTKPGPRLANLSGEPVPAKPDAKLPEPESTEPAVAKPAPDASKPEVAKSSGPDTSKPDVAKSSGPDTLKPDVAKPAAAPSKPDAAKPAPDTSKPASTLPDHVMLHVVSDPPDSTVVLDGVRLGHTPFHGEVPVKKAAWLKVRRSDRWPVRIQVALDHDYTWTVKLAPRRQ